MKIAFSPGGISRDFWIKSPVFQMIPKSVHIRDVKDQPSPVVTASLSSRLRIADCVSLARSEENPVLSPL
jgi:hypothetical protein